MALCPTLLGSEGQRANGEFSYCLEYYNNVTATKVEMLQTDKESLPDDESHDLVIGMLLLTDQIDATLKYIDLTLKSRYILSVNVFTECVRNCVNKGRLDTLVSIIERCKMLQWKRIVANEGLVVSAVGTTGRTNNAKLLDGSWVILKRACAKRRFQTQNLTLLRYMPMLPWGIYRRPLVLCMSLRLLTEILLRKLKRIYSLHLPLCVHWLWHAPRMALFTSEASSVFDHSISKGVKPNSTTYSLFVNTHLIKRDQKAALSVINEVVNSGFEPSREMLKKVRR
ncbi:unnamed protein product [Camellia sinensis]